MLAHSPELTPSPNVPQQHSNQANACTVCNACTVDNTFLSLLLHPDAKPPKHSATGQAIDRLKERIDDLIARWRADRDAILIPTPALSEFLYLAGNDGPTYLAEIDSDSLFTIRGFDSKAAIELAVLNLKISREKSKARQKREDSDSKTKQSFETDCRHCNSEQRSAYLLGRRRRKGIR